MNTVRHSALTLLLSAALTGAAPNPEVQPKVSDFKISGPYTHDNLTVFLVHGEDRLKGKTLIPLAKAIAEKKVVVHETGEVNQLQIENVSKVAVFMQAGDIVKGGRQDRVITLSAILSPKSGRIPVDSFCVESGRWRQRAGESASEFNSAENMLSSKGLKMAAKHAKDQGEVWKNVEELQNKLTRGLGKDVKAAQSASSLELSLRDKDLATRTEEYLAVLEKITAGKNDVVGYAFAINGKMNSAEVYASPRMLEMLWGKLIRSSVVEAISERGGKVETAALAESDVRAFLTVNGERKTTPRPANNSTSEIVSKGRVYVENADVDHGWIQMSFY